ncbi:DUF6884 domain-containing protein [Brochothrix thermosphacta]|uniref:DUF6884 domain-containing protein n=1 Tax=Brochothrix thermosphacta TaxID=2756 RepID=UPI003F9E45D8
MTVIIASGKPKCWDKTVETVPTKASDVYTGTFHRLCRDYTKHFLTTETVLILSPYYGLVELDKVLTETYDVRFNASGINKNTIQASQLKAQWLKLKEPEQPIYLFGGEKFIKVVKAFMTEDEANRVEYPLVGLGGIGYMQQKMKLSLLANEPFHNTKDKIM